MKDLLMRFAALLSILSSGCGTALPLYNSVGQLGTVSNTLSATSKTYGNTVQQGDDSACTGLSSIIPSEFSKSDFLEVCPANVIHSSSDNQSKSDSESLNPVTSLQILIHHQTKATSGYCVFPTALDYSGNITFIINPSTNRVLYSCGTFGPDGLALSFPLAGTSTIINSLFIIDSSQLNKMNVCIQSRLASGCPNYYFGEFTTNQS